jgi:hypothetical protein
MKIVGLCKALTCGDFIPAVMDGIYDTLDHIIFLYPKRAWDGSEIVNEVRPIIRRWRQANDYALKIVEMETAEIDQTLQYRYAVEQIIETLHPDWIFFFDTDEVWDRSRIDSLIALAGDLTEENAIYCGMRTYIKSPLFQIDPIEPCKPCIMIRGVPFIFKGVRGNRTRPGIIAAEHIFFHHFSYVRMTDEEVLRKARLSTLSDGLQTIDLNEWKVEKWDNLPNAFDLHTTSGAERNWKSIRVIDPSELPEAVRALPIYSRRVEV